jgi:hypothetical protein
MTQPPQRPLYLGHAFSATSLTLRGKLRIPLIDAVIHAIKIPTEWQRTGVFVMPSHETLPRFGWGQWCE